MVRKTSQPNDGTFGSLLHASSKAPKLIGRSRSDLYGPRPPRDPPGAPKRHNSHSSRKYADFVKTFGCTAPNENGGRTGPDTDQVDGGPPKRSGLPTSPAALKSKITKALKSSKDTNKHMSTEKKNSKKAINSRAKCSGEGETLLHACETMLSKPAPSLSPIAPVVASRDMLMAKKDLRVKLRDCVLKDRKIRSSQGKDPKDKDDPKSKYARLSPKQKQDLRRHLERFVPRSDSKIKGKKKALKALEHEREQADLNITTGLLIDCDLSDSIDVSPHVATSPLTSPSPRLVSREELLSDMRRRKSSNDGVFHFDLTSDEFADRRSPRDDHRVPSENTSLRVNIPLVTHNTPKRNSSKRNLTPAPKRSPFSRNYSPSMEKYTALPASPSLRQRTPSSAAISPQVSTACTPSRHDGSLAKALRPQTATNNSESKHGRGNDEHFAGGRTRSLSTPTGKRSEIRRYFSFNNNHESGKCKDGADTRLSTSETGSSSCQSASPKPLDTSPDNNLGEGSSISTASDVSDSPVDGRQAINNRTNENPPLPLGERQRSRSSLSNSGLHSIVSTKKNRIRLHVYDLIASEVVVPMPWIGSFPLGRCFNAVNSGLHSLGTGAYHCGVEVQGVEYAYGANDTETTTGVFTCEPMRSPGYQYRTTIDLGERSLVRQIVIPGVSETRFVDWHVDGREVLREMAGQYLGKDYDLLRKNCCTFAHDACLRLGVKEDEIPSWFRNLCQAGALTQDAATSTIEPISKAFGGTWCGGQGTEVAQLESEAASPCATGFLDVTKLRLSLDPGTREHLDNMAKKALGRNQELPAIDA